MFIFELLKVLPLLIVVLLMVLSCWLAGDVEAQDTTTVIPYPPHPGAIPSPAFTVTVNDEPVFVHRFATYNMNGYMDYAHFAMKGKVKIKISLAFRDIITCHISPLAYGVTPIIEGNTVTFELDQPRYLLVFLNEPVRFMSNGLMLFAEQFEKNPPRLGDANVTNIIDYGVDRTGKTLDTEKINHAISAVAAKPGGGILYFPKDSIYLTGTLYMKSNVQLYVEAGALIQGSGKSEDYPAVLNERRKIPRALIYFDNVENAGLLGRGTIDGDGYPALWQSAGGGGIQGYVFYNCRNIFIEDLLLRRSSAWSVHLIDSQYFTSRHVKIVNRKAQYNEDVYDFTTSSHMLVEDGFALTMDDFWAVKGMNNIMGPVEDIVVKGFVGYGYDSGLAIGYGPRECAMDYIKHLRLEDVHFITNMCDYAIWIDYTPDFFSVQPEEMKKRYAHNINVPLDDFRFVNCTFEEDGGAIYIAAGEAKLTNFVFENCTFYHPARSSLISGKNVSPVVFKNCVSAGKVISSVDELRAVGFQLEVPIEFEH